LGDHFWDCANFGVAATPGAHLIGLPSMVDRPRVAQMNPEEFKDFVMTKAKEAFAQHGGPTQFLEARYNTFEKMEKLLYDVHTLFPPASDCVYEIPAGVGEDALGGQAASKIPLGAFGFCRGKSDRGLTEARTSLEQIDDMLTGGFRTSADPLWVRPAESDAEGLVAPWHQVGKVEPFSTAFTRGMGRTASVFTIMSIITDHKAGLDTARMTALHPKLAETATGVYCYHVLFADRKMAIFSSFNLGVRGAMRKPPNPFKWAAALRAIAGWGWCIVSPPMVQLPTQDWFVGASPHGVGGMSGTEGRGHRERLRERTPLLLILLSLLLLLLLLLLRRAPRRC
jgi:hypothetical protein